MGHYDDAYAEEEKAGGKKLTWFEKMHAAAKGSPEYKACMEELIKEEMILSDMRGFIAIGGDCWIVYLNIHSIESVYKDEQSDKCIVTTTSGKNYRPTETPIEIMERINQARK